MTGSIENRAMRIPPGSVVRTDYVPVERIRMGCRDRMAVGDVDRAYQKRIQAAPEQPWPCPNGEWSDDGAFTIIDGRHEFIAAQMLGFEHLLVAWVSPREGVPA